jgi:hypothetical protein
MPSDPAGRKPVGVLARPAPDWFDDHLGVGGFFFTNFSIGNPHYLATVLYNNASDGSALKVYGLGSTSDGGGGMGFYSQQGTFGAFDHNCNPVRADLPTPWGQIFINDHTAASFTDPSPFNIGPLLGYSGSGGNNAAAVFATFPLFVVPAGYSLIAVNTAPGGFLGASFWYQVAHE